MRTLLLASAFASLAQLISSAQTVRYVTSPFDSGAGTFRNVVAQALSGDTIRFQITGTITFTTGPVTYDKDLVIDGPGMDLMTLSGNELGGVLDVTGHSSRISGLSLAHGLINVPSGTSAGLNFTGDTLCLEGVRIMDCNLRASASSLGGGGALIEASRVRMYGCRFENDTVSCLDGGYSVGGGAVINCGDIEIHDCVFTQNASMGSSFASNARASGGGLAISGHALITGCTFDQNYCQSFAPFFGGVYYDASSNGAALYTSDAQVEAVDCAFTNNNTISVAAGEQNLFGAGIHAAHSDLHLRGCSISGNVAGLEGIVNTVDQGGGVYLQNGYLTMDDCVVDGNSAREGSGIFHDIGSGSLPRQGLALRHCRISHGSGDQPRSAVDARLCDRVDLSDVELSDNGQNSLSAGADTIRVDRCLFAGNHGGVSIYNPSTNENFIRNSTFTQSAVSTSALYAYNTTFYLVNCTMIDDSLTIPGARELALDNSTVWLENTVIGETWSHGNDAFGGPGAVVISGGGNVCSDGSLAAFLAQPTDANNTTPGVGTFGDHGGATRTWSLAANSTCIDRGGADTLAVDQRGFLRDANSDAGAFEFGAADPVINILFISADSLVCEGHPLIVSVTASSSLDLSFQWYLDGQPIAGATDMIYSTTAGADDIGGYSCSIVNELTSVLAGPVHVDVQICEGMADLRAEDLLIYPNPTDAIEGLTIRTGNGTKVLGVRLMDPAGRLVLQRAMPTTLPLAGLSGGVYMLALEMDGSTVYRRIVVR